MTTQELKPKCDGNHGGPRCADPECWNDSALNTRQPEPAGEAVAWLWKYVGKDPYPMALHGKSDGYIARSIKEMDPNNPPYPDTWQPVSPLVHPPAAAPAPTTSGFVSVVPGSFVPNPEMSMEVPGLTKVEAAEYLGNRQKYEQTLDPAPAVPQGAIVGYRVSHPTEPDLGTWLVEEAPTDPTDLLVEPLVLAATSTPAPAQEVGLTDEAQATPIPCAVTVGATVFEAGTPFCDVVDKALTDIEQARSLLAQAADKLDDSGNTSNAALLKAIDNFLAR